jgi:hypothetical protein
VTRTRRSAALATGCAAATAALALGTGVLATTAGGAGHPARVATSAARPVSPPLPTATPTSEDAWDDASAATAADDIRSPLEDLPVLSQIWLGDEPSGTGPQIALRFLQALQRHDDLAADRELYREDREWIAEADRATLARVLEQVRRNARLNHAAPCTRAVRLNAEAALASCGALRVVVHVLHDDLASGVQIGQWAYHHDVYHGPHTHAMSNQYMG